MRRRLQRRLDLRLYRNVRRLVVASESLRDTFAAAGLDPARIRVVPPGRDPAVAGEPAGDLRRGRAIAVLCVANWIPRKGVDALLEAVARLPPEAATLHLAGDENADRPYGRRLAARVGRDDLKDRVVRHGVVQPERVASLYAVADVFALPSLEEPYGTVYGEAMAAGLPVVGWRLGNLPFLARDGIEGFVLAPNDVDALARALQHLADDEPMRLRLGEAARRRAATFPTWRESARLFFECVREAVEEPERPGRGP